MEAALDSLCSVAPKSAAIVGGLVLPIKEHDVVKTVHEERVSERIADQRVDVLVVAD